MNPFHRKSSLEKVTDSLGDVAKHLPWALGGLAGLAAGSAALSRRRRRREASDGDA